MLRIAKGDQTDEGVGGRSGHAERGFRGREGLWEVGRGRKGREHRDGRWRPAGVEVFPVVQEN